MRLNRSGRAGKREKKVQITKKVGQNKRVKKKGERNRKKPAGGSGEKRPRAGGQTRGGLRTPVKGSREDERRHYARSLTKKERGGTVNVRGLLTGGVDRTKRKKGCRLP